MSELTDSTCARHRDALAQAAELAEGRKHSCDKCTEQRRADGGITIWLCPDCAVPFQAQYKAVIAEENATESHAEPCQVCGQPTTSHDAYGPLCPECCEEEAVTLTPESSAAVLKRLSEPANPTPGLRALLHGHLWQSGGRMIYLIALMSALVGVCLGFVVGMVWQAYCHGLLDE